MLGENSQCRRALGSPEKSWRAWGYDVGAFFNLGKMFEDHLSSTVASQGWEGEGVPPSEPVGNETQSKSP